MILTRHPSDQRNEHRLGLQWLHLHSVGAEPEVFEPLRGSQNPHFRRFHLYLHRMRQELFLLSKHLHYQQNQFDYGKALTQHRSTRWLCASN